MKTRKTVLFFLLILGISLAITQSVHAYGSESSTPGDVISINPNASGTKLTGPLTIYLPYSETPDYYSANCWASGVPYKSTMYFFIRLRKGSTLYPFSGQAPNICVADINQQQAAIKAYIQTVVIPNIFPDNPNALFDLKNVDQMVMDSINIRDINGNLVYQPPFTIMDIEIAVRN